MSTNSEWVSVSVTPPPAISTAISQLDNILTGVSTILESTAAVLEVVKIFLVDVTNPIASILQTFSSLTDTIIADLNKTGLYLYVDLPKFTDDGYGSNLLGGMTAWRQRMTYAFLSPDVTDKPNFSNTASAASFHIVVTSSNIGELLQSFGFLLALFKQKSTPEMNPPKNFQVRAINKDFYDTYYNSMGYLDDTKITQEQNLLINNTASITQAFMSGGTIVNPETLNLVLRYDVITGEEFIIDLSSGAVLSNGGTPDASLLTWKLDQKLIPNTFRIERTEVKGGTVETHEEKDTDGNVVSTELTKDQNGQPIVSADTIDTISVNFGYGDAMVGAANEQFVYLDTNVQPGKTYYYRVVPIYGVQSNVATPTIDPSVNEITKKINSLINSMIKASQGEGIPSEFKGVYIPNEEDENNIRPIAFQSVENGDQWWTASDDITNVGWTKAAISDLFDPIMIVADQLKNFADYSTAAIEGSVSQTQKFIDLLQIKINTINNLIQTLQAIISLLEVLETIPFGCLSTTTDEGNMGILRSINNASLEDTPVASDADYVASISMVGGTVGVASAINALKLIFGI
jgi:hypothetical protein